jgi:hypothetical protein
MRLVRILTGIVVVLLLLVVGYFVMAESGEVVVLETRDAVGAHETRVWWWTTAAPPGCAPGTRRARGSRACARTPRSR